MKIFFTFLIKTYQACLAPFIVLFPGGGCRFYPTCSEYTFRAIHKHGALKGGVLGIKRLLKCNPWN